MSGDTPLDQFDLAGSAAAYIAPDGDREPAVVKGSVRETEEQVRVFLELEDQEQLLDTNRENVEVMA